MSADVLLDDKLFGTPPLRTEMLRKNRDVKLVLRLRGYNDQTVTVRTDAPSKQAVQLVPVAHNKVVNPF